GSASRILFTSGDTVSTDTRGFFEASGRPYIMKPFKINELIAAVERVILTAASQGTRSKN
ncbi:MAG: hypothetical protein V3V17_01575, partial [Alphaproteobacteria bacterium]